MLLALNELLPLLLLPHAAEKGLLLLLVEQLMGIISWLRPRRLHLGLHRLDMGCIKGGASGIGTVDFTAPLEGV